MNSFLDIVFVFFSLFNLVKLHVFKLALFTGRKCCSISQVVPTPTCTSSISTDTEVMVVQVVSLVFFFLSLGNIGDFQPVDMQHDDLVVECVCVLNNSFLPHICEWKINGKLLIIL